LLWTTNTDQVRSLAGVSAHYHAMIAEALSLAGF